MPVPAPRHKGEQKSEISHPFPNKTPDNIITGKYVIHVQEFKNIRLRL